MLTSCRLTLPKITPKVLKARPELLAHNPPTSTDRKSLTIPFSCFTSHCEPTVSAYDGKVGAVVDDGTFFVTSPNVSYILAPPFGGDRKFFLRSNFRYGDDDPTQWPQPFTRTKEYLPAMPFITLKSNPHLYVMTTSLSDENFIRDSECAISGFGKLNSSVITQLNNLITPLYERLDKLPIPANHSHCHVIQSYLPLLKQYLFRLEHLSTTFTSTEWYLAGTQRLYLELHAICDWHEIFLPRISSQDTTAPRLPVASTIGAFVTDSRHAENLYKAGIRFWFVRPYKEVVNARVRKVISAEDPGKFFRMDAHHSRGQEIYCGAFRDPQLHLAMVDRLKLYLTYPDAFGLSCAPSTSSAAELPPPPSQEQPNRKNSTPCEYVRQCSPPISDFFRFKERKGSTDTRKCWTKQVR